MKILDLFHNPATLRIAAKPAVALENVRVAAPCPASWEKMVGDGRVRYCGECKLNVYNLSEMTRREAEGLIANREGRLCVRFYRRADGTILTQNCPRGLQAVIRRVSRVAGAVLSAVMTFSFTACQSMMMGTVAVHDHAVDEASGSLFLTVVDPQGALVVGARVRLTNTETGVVFVQVSDSTGMVRFQRVPAGSYQTKVDAQYFKSLHLDLSIQKKQHKTMTASLKLDKGSTTVEVGGLDIPMLSSTDKQVTNTFSGPSWPPNLGPGQRGGGFTPLRQ